MIQPTLSIQFEGNKRVYLPGTPLRGSGTAYAVRQEDISAVELSVMWYTEGKGDEDLDVHYFRRIPLATDDDSSAAEPFRFETTLPDAPLSYNGRILRVRWCVRMRVFLRRGKELFEEEPFRLGDIPLQREMLE